MLSLNPGEVSPLSSGTADQLLSPRYVLREPTSAPADLLSLVRVNTEHGLLEANTNVGRVALKLFWEMTEGSGDMQSAQFFEPLSPRLDPGAAENPYTTQTLPYSILPNRALYGIGVTVPGELVDDEPTISDRNLNHDFDQWLETGILLSDFRRLYKSVDTGDLPEGSYQINATEESRRTVAIAARVEDCEPLIRLMSIAGDQTTYYEKLDIGAHRVDGAERYITGINSRYTMAEGSNEMTEQRLEFVYHDGWQRTGERALVTGGMVELILYSVTQVKQYDFRFSVPRQKIYWPDTVVRSKSENPSRWQQRMIFSGLGSSEGSDESPVRPEGLIAGETRYQKPQTIEASMTGARDIRPIAAFRFALAGQ